MELTASGWINGVRHVPSPNFNQRPANTTIDLLVIHNISLPPEQFGTPDIDALFTNQLRMDKHPFYASLQGVQVSAHCLIARDGKITQYVSLFDRAWHAGTSSFQGRDNCNNFSIGIEVEGSDHQPFEDAQYQTLNVLIPHIMQWFPNIMPAHITGHSDIAPGRKTDPGPYFDWQRLHLI